jgi:hypothetical protein
VRPRSIEYTPSFSTESGVAGINCPESIYLLGNSSKDIIGGEEWCGVQLSKILPAARRKNVWLANAMQKLSFKMSG